MKTKMRQLTRRRFLATSLGVCAAGARFIRGASLVAETLAGRDVPWLAEVQTPPGKLPPGVPKLRPVLADAQGRPIESLAAWQSRRAEIRREWLDFLGTVKVERESPPPLKVLAEDRIEGVVRQLVRYDAEPGISAEAYLLKPAKPDGRAPGVVVLHSTDNATIRQGAGLGGPPEKAFGVLLARRGCVAICPRCFLWPNDLEPDADRKLSYADRVKRFQSRHPGCKGMAKMLFDARTALDLLAAMPEVDPKRLGTVGHSLGGKEVLYLAAFDERVKAAVSSEGGIGTRYSNWDAPWYLSDAIRRPDFAREHHELLALVAPRAFLLLGGDSADGDRSWPFIEAALPVYKLYGGPARLGLFNHKQGHSVPPEAERRVEAWFGAYL